MKTINWTRRALVLLLVLLLCGAAACSSRPESMMVGAPAAEEPAPAEEPAEEPASVEEPAGEPASVEESDEEPEEDPASVEEPAGEPEEEPAGEIPEDDYMAAHDPWLREPTPEARAAARGLPAPPEVDLSSWEFNLANSNNSIGEYRPHYGYAASVEFDARASDAATAFITDAIAAGNSVFLRAGYIGYEVQGDNLWTPKLYEYGAWKASRVEYGAGTSDHQTALAIDVGVGGGNSGDAYQDFKDSPACAWLMEHCADYGFVFRFPEGKEYYYGLACRRGGHFRYVGQEAARYIMDNDLCLEEFMLIIDPDSVFIPSIGWDDLEA